MPVLERRQTVPASRAFSGDKTRTECDESQAAAATVQATPAVAGICKEIRWLRQGTAMVATCDAVLGARVERMRHMQASHRFRLAEAGTGVNAVRLRAAQLRLHDQISTRRFRLFLANMMAAWVEARFSSRRTYYFLVTFNQMRLLLHALECWRLSAGEQRVSGEMARLQVALCDAREQSDAQIAELQSRYIRVQQIHGRHCYDALGRFLFTHDASLMRLAFSMWTAYQRVIVNRRAWQGKRLAHCSVVGLMGDLSELSALLREWWHFSIAKRRTDAASRVLETTLRRLAGPISKGGTRRLLEAWKIESTHAKRQREAVHFQEQLNAEISRRTSNGLMQAKATRARFAEKTTRAFWWAIDKETQVIAFRALRDAVNRTRWTLRSQELRQNQTYFEAMLCGRRRANRLAVTRRCASVLFARLWLLFVEWGRISLRVDRERFAGALSQHQLLGGEVQKQQWHARQREARYLLNRFCRLSSAKVELAQHRVLERWRLGAWRVAAECLRDEAVSQRTSLRQAHLEAVDMHKEVLKQRVSAVRVASRMIISWQADVSRAALGMWAVVASELGMSRHREQQANALEASCAQLKAFARTHLTRRAQIIDAAFTALAAREFSLAALHAWEQAAVHELIARESQGLAYTNHCAEQEAVRGYSAARRERLLTPLQRWVATHLGSKRVLASTLWVATRKWYQAVLQAKLSRHRSRQVEALRNLVASLCEEVCGTINRSALVGAFASWRFTWHAGLAVRDRANMEEVRHARKVTLHRLRCYASLTTMLEGPCDAIDLALRAFGDWRWAVGVTVVERTGTQVCTSLADRIAKGRCAVEADKSRSIAGLSVSIRMTRGSAYITRLAMVLCFPAWQRAARSAKLRQDLFAKEAHNLAELEGLQRRASEFRGHWALWTMSRRLRLGHSATGRSLLQSWRLAVSKKMVRQGLATAEATSIAVAGSVLGRSQGLIEVCFVEWQRHACIEAVRSLEGRMKDLEAQLMQAGAGDEAALAELSDSASSDDSGASERSNATVMTLESRASRGSRRSTARDQVGPSRPPSSIPLAGRLGTHAVPPPRPQALGDGRQGDSASLGPLRLQAVQPTVPSNSVFSTALTAESGSNPGASLHRISTQELRPQGMPSGSVSAATSAAGILLPQPEQSTTTAAVVGPAFDAVDSNFAEQLRRFTFGLAPLP